MRIMLIFYLNQQEVALLMHHVLLVTIKVDFVRFHVFVVNMIVNG